MKICFSSNPNLQKEIFLFASVAKGAEREQRFCNYIKLSNVEPGIRILTKSSSYHIKNSSRESRAKNTIVLRR